jgi:hypothetical protein
MLKNIFRSGFINLFFLATLLPGIVIMNVNKVFAQGQAGTTLIASKAATGFFERRIEYDWTIQKTVDQNQIEIGSGGCTTVNYTLNTTRSETSRTDLYGVRGQICVTNGGAVTTENLTIVDQIQFKMGAGQFQDLAGATVTITPSPIVAGDTVCYPYEIAFTPTPGAVYRNVARITITNHSGNLGTPFGPEPKADFSIPAEPAVSNKDFESTITDLATCPAGFTCTTVDTGSGIGPWLLTDTGSVSYGVSICNTQADCSSIFQLINTATMKEKDTGQELSSSATVNITTSACSFGCSLTIGFWKTHAGFTGHNPDLLTGLLPIYLGTLGGSKSINVTTAKQAVSLLNMSGNASNGINKLYAQLLAAKLNIARGADGSAIKTTISAADAFLATKNSNDWGSLTNSQKQMVLSWANTLDNYNNGLIGPGHCQ